MDVRTASPDDLHPLGALAESLQRRPERHIGYLSMDAGDITAEVEEVAGWTEVSAVVHDQGRLVGWLVGDTDLEIGRVWWFGPFIDHADWASVADVLFAHATSLLPDGIGQHEMAIDGRFVDLAKWSGERGFVAETASIVLTLDDIAQVAAPVAGARPVVEADLDTVGRLHSQLFGNTHMTARQLVADGDATHLRLAVELDGAVAGYVAVEQQPNGDGYIDHLGVEPEFRRTGIGAALIRAGLHELQELGCSSANLTVRAASRGARALYASLGFFEERELVPLRLGFSLD